MQQSCKQICADDLETSSRWLTLRNFFVFHLLRRYPAWAGWLPAHVPRIMPALETIDSGASNTRGAGADAVSRADPA